jgi:hypothetical protein
MQHPTKAAREFNVLAEGWLEALDPSSGKPYNEQTGDESRTLPNNQDNTAQVDNTIFISSSITEEIQEAASTAEPNDDSTMPIPTRCAERTQASGRLGACYGRIEWKYLLL